jgi:hypothetical protein
MTNLSRRKRESAGSNSSTSLSKKRRLSHYQFSEIFDSGIWASLSPSAKALYPVLLKFANLKSRLAWPKMETAMKLSGIKKPHTFGKAIRELTEKKLIKKTWLAPAMSGGFRRKRFYQMPRVGATKGHVPDAVNGHMAIKGVSDGHMPIKPAANGHLKRSEREERDPALKRTSLASEKADFADSEGTASTAYPKPLLDDLKREYGAVIVEEAIQKSSGKVVRYPLAYLRTTCGSIASRQREERLEGEASESKQKYRMDSGEAGDILAGFGVNCPRRGTCRSAPTGAGMKFKNERGGHHGRE